MQWPGKLRLSWAGSPPCNRSCSPFYPFDPSCRHLHLRRPLPSHQEQQAQCRAVRCWALWEFVCHSRSHINNHRPEWVQSRAAGVYSGGVNQSERATRRRCKRNCRGESLSQPVGKLLSRAEPKRYRSPASKLCCGRLRRIGVRWAEFRQKQM